MRSIPRTLLLFGAILVAIPSALLIAGCGGEKADQFSNEAAGDFPVEIIDSSFKPLQTVAQTYELTIAARNSGDETIPAINAVIDLPGMGSTMAFAYGNKQKGLAMNQRPVWVIEEGWPKLADTTGRGGATTADRRTFEFGELEAGETANMVWRLVAVRPGNYRLRYQVNAGLGPQTTTVDESGEVPTGTHPVRISNFARLTRVNDKGQVVPLTRAEQAKVEFQQKSAETDSMP